MVLPLSEQFHMWHSTCFCETTILHPQVKDKGNVFSMLNKSPCHKGIWGSGGREPAILNHYITSLRVNELIYIMIINDNENKNEKFLSASDICFHLVTNLFCGTFQTV
jgi:hypothetical protein